MNRFQSILTICICLLIAAPLQAQKKLQKKIDGWVNELMPATLAEHYQFVSLPNDNQSVAEMVANVEWMKTAFEKRGFEFQSLSTPSVPVGFAQKIIDPSLPTVLFYFHYDGQPVDAAEWDQEDPFVPVVKAPMVQVDGSAKYQILESAIYENWDPEWRIYARAAADDKGPIMMFLAANDLMKANKLSPAYNIKVMLDGEEEKGSEGLSATLEAYKSKYNADVMIIMDGPNHPSNLPTLTFGCRGITSATLTVYGAKVPQHSGHYGNYAPNPVFRMSHLFSTMKDENGKVIIPGFYDGIDLNDQVQDILQGVPDDQAAINTQIGVAAAEQVGSNYQESLQYPSLNVRGMASGWIGAQTRTIVPDKATAQLGIRLVVESDGNRLLGLVRKHIEGQGYYVIDREPTDAERLEHEKIATFKAGSVLKAFRTDLDTPTADWLRTAINNVYGEDPVQIRTMGGTVPITPIIQALDVPAVIVPMVNMDNNQHSPNENLRLGNLVNGIKTCVGILTTEIGKR